MGELENCHKPQSTLENFQKNFTHEQKAAIIGSMLVIAKTQAGLTKTDITCIEATAKILDFSIDDPALVVISQKGKANLYSILDTLSKDNKEWFAIAVHGLVGANGQPEARKIDLAFAFLNAVGIDDDEFGRIIEKSKALHKRFY